MSRWLRSVNNLLEQLDGQVGTAAEETRAVIASASSSASGGGRGGGRKNGRHSRDEIQDILTRRGLLSALEGDEEEEEEDDDDDEEEKDFEEDSSFDEEEEDEEEEDEEDDESEEEVEYEEYSDSEDSRYEDEEEEEEEEGDDADDEEEEETVELESGVDDSEASELWEPESSTMQQQQSEAPPLFEDSDVDNSRDGDDTERMPSPPRSGSHAAAMEQAQVDIASDDIAAKEPQGSPERGKQNQQGQSALSPERPGPERSIQPNLAPGGLGQQTAVEEIKPDEDVDGGVAVSPSNTAPAPQISRTMHVESPAPASAPFSLPPSSSSVPPTSGNLSIQSAGGSAAATAGATAGAAAGGTITTSNDVAQLQRRIKSLTREVKRAQNEAQTLRGHVVSLHSQLEVAEGEMSAQRSELHRAAERMERDRTRHRDEVHDLRIEHEEETEHLKEEYEHTMEEQRLRYEEQLDELHRRLNQTEERRIKEDGNWTKELEDSIRREQDALKKLKDAEDENTALHSEASKLKATNKTLRGKLDSAVESIQNSTEREREMEDKLDAALSLHARQLQQRQAREAELEKTVADLGAALVVARDRELNRIADEKKKKKKKGGVGNSNDGRSEIDEGNYDDDEDEEEDSSMREKLKSIQEELEATKGQLLLEKERCTTLQRELEDISKERAEEALAAEAQQRQYEQRVADLTSNESRLQASLRELKRGMGNDDEETNDNENIDERGSSLGIMIARLKKKDEESTRQIASLSEQVLRQQGKIDDCTSEVLTLRNRLRTALNRAENAEKALASAPNVTSSPSSDLFDVELGGTVGTTGPYGGKVRRRGGGGGGGSGRGSTRLTVKSIRSALQLPPGRGGNAHEQIGKTIDALDSWSVDTGAYLRHNPLARLAFLLYLMLLHVWTFCLVVFHAHTFETEHGDFGSMNVPHGPAAMLRHSYRHMEQLHRNP